MIEFMIKISQLKAKIYRKLIQISQLETIGKKANPSGKLKIAGS